MDSVETKYDFYKRGVKGGAQTQPQSETIDLQPQQQEQIQAETQEQTQLQEQVQSETQSMGPDGATLKQLNEQIPKNKINFKVSSIVGNLDQTLGPTQKVNIDKLLISQLLGIN